MQDELELAQTIGRRIAAHEEIARTFVDAPFATIKPHPDATQRNVDALELLRALSGGLDQKLVLHRTLGQGGMGVVHLATQATVGRHVAVKTLRDGVTELDATVRVLREAWVTGTLEHPSIVPIYDVGVNEGGSPVIVMKRIEGSVWHELMSAPDVVRERFGVSDPLEWNLRILIHVCNAAHFAHSRGILHRDLKPDNVMIGAFGEVYVLDWGIAVSILDDPSGRLPLASEAIEIAGTPCYVAPEMLLGDPSALSPRTDVYLLGAIFYEIFAGKPPHDGDTIHALVTSALRSEFHYAPSFPLEAARICKKAMARRPDDRYESAEQFRVAVEAYLQHRGSRKLAHDAKRSLTRLLDAIANEPRGEDRSLAIFNLLGECRFGYRSALSAWPDNETAQKGLDQALLAVIEHELDEGNAHAASILLREVSDPPSHVQVRIERASRAHLEHDARVKRLEQDFDPSIGSRTRVFIGGVFGTFWTLIPLFAWYAAYRGAPETHFAIIAWSVGFLLFGSAVLFWARETFQRTLFNRRIGTTMLLHFVAQVLVGVTGSMAGLHITQTHLLLLLAWTATQTSLAVWAHPRFAVSALSSAIALVASARWPSAQYGLTTLVNFIFTVVLVQVWVPREMMERIQGGRLALRERRRQWLESTEGRSTQDP